MMQQCEVCGNHYDRCFEVILDGQRHMFDCFECAIHALAPTCTRCGCKVIGHGVQAESKIYCCANCAKAEDITGLTDRV